MRVSTDSSLSMASMRRCLVSSPWISSCHSLSTMMRACSMCPVNEGSVWTVDLLAESDLPWRAGAGRGLGRGYQRLQPAVAG